MPALIYDDVMWRTLFSGLVSAALLAVASTFGATVVRPQFVGCKSDGQMGPQPAPKSASDIPRLPLDIARRLAYYKSTNLGVLAPRGWRCFGLYGSNGAILLVTPNGFGKNVFDLHVTGPAVQLSGSLSETSGRFQAARIAARLFPGRAKFVQGVIAEGIFPKSDFPSGPFPADIIRPRGPDLVEFETPANRDGMGTQSRLEKNSDSISGVAIMDKENNATVLVVRLPPALSDLGPAIIRTIR